MSDQTRHGTPPAVDRGVLLHDRITMSALMLQEPEALEFKLKIAGRKAGTGCLNVERDRPERGYRGPRGMTIPRPSAIPGAEWQPAVTPGADALRPTLDGEPVPGAVAASVSRGWVYVAPLDLLSPPLRGVVRLVAVGRGRR